MISVINLKTILADLPDGAMVRSTGSCNPNVGDLYIYHDVPTDRDTIDRTVWRLKCGHEDPDTRTLPEGESFFLKKINGYWSKQAKPRKRKR
jgi:hypothetical protein